jgi:hypothetical protein
MAAAAKAAKEAARSVARFLSRDAVAMQAVCASQSMPPPRPASIASSAAAAAGGGGPLSALLDSGIASFARGVLDLKDQSIVRMNTTADQEEAARKYYEECKLGTERLDEDRAALEIALAKLRSEKEAELSQLNEAISKLKAELSDIKQTAALEAASLAKEMRERDMANHAAFSDRQTSLGEELSKLRERFQQQRQAHAQEEDTLRKKKVKLEVEVQLHVRQFDEELSSRQRRIEEIAAMHAEERRRLLSLEEYFALVDRNKAIEDLEEVDVAKERAVKAAKLQREHDAATMLQVSWRRFKARRELRKKKAAKKGKKGGGKKKKK